MNPNNIIAFKEGQCRNLPVQNRPQTTERQVQMNNQISSKPSSTWSKCMKKWWPFILIASVLILAGIIVAIVFATRNENKEEKTDKESTPAILSLPGIDIEKTKQVFSPSFKISSKEKILTQLSQKSFQIYETISNNEKTLYSFLNKAIYDIYTINSTSSSNSENIFYTTKYTTVITVNSLCSKVSINPEEDDCQLGKQLDLNQKNENKLRRNEENAEDLIRQAILPICIIEHTDTNLIISLTCPETLDPSYKEDIIRAFSNIKPDSMKGFDFDKNYVDTITEEKEDKIYIYSFDNICSEPNVDLKKTIICNMSKNIITDKEGNLISSKISNVTKTINDENNSFSNNFTYEFTNVPKENSESFDEKTYQKNLETILSLTRSLMKKEIFIDNITNLAIDLMTEDGIQTNVELRDLMEQESSNPGVQEENVFNKTIVNISMDLNLKNDVGLTEDKTTKASSIHNVNKENHLKAVGNNPYLVPSPQNFIY